MPMPRSSRFAVLPDPGRPGHHRVYDTVTRSFIGRSYAVLRHAQAAADRRNNQPRSTPDA